MTNEKITAFASLAEKSATAGTLLNIVFHSPKSSDELKAKGILRSVSGKTVVQIETSLTEGRVRQKNVLPESLPDVIGEMLGTFTKADLNDVAGSASLMISKKGAVTLLKKGKIGDGNAKYLWIRSIAGGIGMICNFYAIDHMAISDASVLNKLSPFFAIIFSIFVFIKVRERKIK